MTGVTQTHKWKLQFSNCYFYYVGRKLYSAEWWREHIWASGPNQENKFAGHVI